MFFRGAAPYQKSGRFHTGYTFKDSNKNPPAMRGDFIFGHSPNTTGCAQVRFLLPCRPCNDHRRPINGLSIFAGSPCQGRCRRQPTDTISVVFVSFFLLPLRVRLLRNPALFYWYCSKIHRAQRIPSTAAEVMPPAYPAPSPHGYNPLTVLSPHASRSKRTGDDERDSTPVSTAS